MYILLLDTFLLHLQNEMTAKEICVIYKASFLGLASLWFRNNGKESQKCKSIKLRCLKDIHERKGVSEREGCLEMCDNLETKQTMDF